MAEPVTESAASIRVMFLRGTEEANDTYTGPVGELTVDLDNWRLRIHDGLTAGGHPISNQADLEVVSQALANLSMDQIGGVDDYPNQTEVQALIDASIEALELELAGGSANATGDPTVDFSAKTFHVYESILPANTDLDIGSATNRFRSIYVDEAYLSTNTLWIGDTPIMGTEQDSILVQADVDQSIKIRTHGEGRTGLISTRGVDISTSGMNGDIQLNANGFGARVVLGAEQSVDVTADEFRVFGTLVTNGAQTVAGDLTVQGNFSVIGEISTIDVQNIRTTDNTITLNHGEEGDGVTGDAAGIIIDRGNLTSYNIIFDELDDLFKVGMIGDLEIIASREWVLNNVAHSDHTHNPVTTAVSGMMTPLDKVKLDGIETGAQRNVAPTKAEIDALNINAFKVNGFEVNQSVPADAVFTDTLYDAELALKVDKVDGMGLSENDFTDALKDKLDTIENGGQINTVHSVAGKVGDILLEKGDVGLDQVNNTSDVDKPVSTAQQAALDLKVSVNAIVNTLTSTATDAPLSAAQGKALKDTIDGINALLSSDDPALDTLQELVDFVKANDGDLSNLTVANIAGLQAALDAKVDQVTGKGLSTNDFTDTLKNKLDGVENGAQVNVGTNLALTGTGNTRQITSSTGGSATIPIASTTNAGLLSFEDKVKLNDLANNQFDATGDYPSLRARGTTKDDVGLSEVNNTSDANKPISTAQQAALDAKVTVVAGKGLSANDFTDSLLAKLESIESGGEVNTVTSVAGKIGNVTLVKSDVGLSEVNNTSDSAKPVSTAQQAALDLKVDIASIINDLTTPSGTQVPLSAAQGAVLKGFIDDINALLTSDDVSLDSLQEVVDFVKANREDIDLLSVDNIPGLSDRLDQKVDKVIGMGLSANDFTDSYRNKLDNVQAGAEVNVATDLAFSGTGNSRVLTSSTGANAPIALATGTNAGLLSTEDKTKLDGLTQYTGDAFDQTADYPSLRARATTKEDVGLGLVNNVASYSIAEVDALFADVYSISEVDALLASVNPTGELVVGPDGRAISGVIDCGTIA
jgi:hypothetical protein